MKALLFPGQGSQSVGMAKDHYDQNSKVKEMFNLADEKLGYHLTEIMFDGPAEKLMQTQYTQPAIFIHSVSLFETLDFKPDVTAGHSLGEFSALVVADVLDFKEALELVALRGKLMQEAGEIHPGSMAAIIGMDDDVVDEICEEATNTINKPVVAANYNCPGQLVISGDTDAVEKAVELAKDRGCRIAKMLPVSGAFHSPLMEPALLGLQEKVNDIEFNNAKFPVYSNYTAKPTTVASELKENILLQLTNPVRWTDTLKNMADDGVNDFIEVGPGKVLQGLVKRTISNANISGYE